MKLRPVVYNFEAEKFDLHLMKDVLNVPVAEDEDMNERAVDYSDAESMRQSGFIAQEVEAAAAATGYDFNGVVKPENEDQTYALSYSLFVVPLVKAIQEQQQMIEALKAENETLRNEFLMLLAEIQSQLNAPLTAHRSLLIASPPSSGPVP